MPAPAARPANYAEGVGWETIHVRTARRTQMLDITEEVAKVVEGSQVMEGICHVFVEHTTAGVTINEGADPDVARRHPLQIGQRRMA